MGSKKGEGGHYLPDNPSVTAFAVTAPFTQGSLSAAAGVWLPTPPGSGARAGGRHPDNCSSKGRTRKSGHSTPQSEQGGPSAIPAD